MLSQTTKTPNTPIDPRNAATGQAVVAHWVTPRHRPSLGVARCVCVYVGGVGGGAHWVTSRRRPSPGVARCVCVYVGGVGGGHTG